MVLGRRGTALWLDAMTDPSTPSVAADFGQRIMGRVLASPSFPSFTHSPSPELSVPHVGAMSASDALNLDMYMPDEDVSVTLHVRTRNDGWNKLAVDEEQGLIAVGCIDGSVCVYDYAPP